jgi:hypothetical protein
VPRQSAATWESRTFWGLLGLSAVTITATRLKPGTSPARSSIRFALNTCSRLARPMMLPQGRARLAIKPRPAGSLAIAVMTIGTVLVACLAAWAAAVPAATITSTGRRASSAATGITASRCPLALGSSKTMLWPSSQPSPWALARNSGERSPSRAARDGQRANSRYLRSRAWWQGAPAGQRQPSCERAQHRNVTHILPPVRYAVVCSEASSGSSSAFAATIPAPIQSRHLQSCDFSDSHPPDDARPVIRLTARVSAG